MRGKTPDAIADELLTLVVDKLAEARADWPRVDFSARIYGCNGCGTIDACVAPRAELTDPKACPSCGEPAGAWTSCAP
jgi:hypothetical protein